VRWRASTDWPQCSWATAWQNTSACPPSSLPVSSIYQRLRERNLCNHRDFTVRGGLLLVSLLVFLSMRVSVLLLLNSPTS
jgi:hypothetical protein